MTGLKTFYVGIIHISEIGFAIPLVLPYNIKKEAYMSRKDDRIRELEEENKRLHEWIESRRNQVEKDFLGSATKMHLEEMLSFQEALNKLNTATIEMLSEKSDSAAKFPEDLYNDWKHLCQNINGYKSYIELLKEENKQLREEIKDLKTELSGKNVPKKKRGRKGLSEEQIAKIKKLHENSIESGSPLSAKEISMIVNCSIATVYKYW